MTTINNFIDKISNEQTALLPAVEFRGKILLVEQERDIAEFLADIVSVSVADGADQFVAFLDDVFAEAFGRLYPVPGAAVRLPQEGHDPAQIFHIIMRFLLKIYHNSAPSARYFSLKQALPGKIGQMTQIPPPPLG